MKLTKLTPLLLIGILPQYEKELHALGSKTNYAGAFKFLEQGDINSLLLPSINLSAQ